MRPAALGWLLVLYGLLATAVLAISGVMGWRAHQAREHFVAFADSVRVDFKSKRCVYMPAVDTVANPRRR